MRISLRRLRKDIRTTESWGALERNIWLRVLMALLVLLVIAVCTWGFLASAPPTTLTLAAGPAGSQFQRNAEKYRDILKRSGITLKILATAGSVDNIQRLNDPRQHVDIGLVQGGMARDIPTDRVVSLGSLFYQPLLIFYRSPAPLTLLSQFKGRRLVIGPDGSGAHQWALTLLQLNGIQPGGDTVLLDEAPAQASRDLLEGRVDAVFLMGDAASLDTMRTLFHDQGSGLRLFSFGQADAYVRKNGLLSKLQLPMGSLDLGRNIPDSDVMLVGPTVELVARPGLHPALSDLLLEAAREVNGRPSLFQKRGEFPAPLEHEFRISEDAQRYYSSGKSFLYRHLPFWLASLADRLLALVLPVLLLLIPGFRLLPALWQWRMRARILRWYSALLMLERDVGRAVPGSQREELLLRLQHIERAASRLKVPLAFADQFYVLRQHIDYVRQKLLESAAEEAGGAAG